MREMWLVGKEEVAVLEVEVGRGVKRGVGQEVVGSGG
jgi:hypothetical protein